MRGLGGMVLLLEVGFENVETLTNAGSLSLLPVLDLRCELLGIPTIPACSQASPARE